MLITSSTNMMPHTVVNPQDAIEEALSKAGRVRASFAQTPTRLRSAALAKIADAIASDSEDLARLIVSEGIKTIREARSEVSRAQQTFRVAGEACVTFTGELIDFERTEAGAGRWGHSERRPLGVVLGVTPYNDPLNLVAHKIAPAIAVGAPVIIKPHEATPTPALRLAQYADRTDLPSDAVQVVQGGPADVRRMASDPRVRVVSFTGGSKAGLAVARAAVGKVTLLELGGIGASYVHADANAAKAAQDLASGIVWAGGQNCVHTQHVVVHRAVANDLCKHLIAALSAMRCGDRLSEATDVARQISRDRANSLDSLIDSAVQAGATELVRVRCDDPQTVGPCLLGEVPAYHPVAAEEVFGPIAVLSIVDSLDEAVQHVQCLGPSINTSIFSDSISAVRTWHHATDSGTTVVNDSTDFRIDHMPFGGNGMAGVGREGVRSAMNAISAPRVLVMRAGA